MKIPIPQQQQEQNLSTTNEYCSDEEEEDDFSSSSLSYCSSIMDYHRRGYSYVQQQQQQQQEEGGNSIWCDICKQEGFEEVATHYCPTCFKEAYNNKKKSSTTGFIVQHNDNDVREEIVGEEETEEENSICHYCQYHVNRHSRIHPIHQIVSIRQGTDRVFHHFPSFISSFDSNMSNSPISYSTSSTSTGPMFNYCNSSYNSCSIVSNNNNLLGNNCSAGSFGSAVGGNNSIRYCFQHEEAIPLNTYCRTCELIICSQCALSKSHKGHTIELIKDVEHSERVQLGEHIKSLQQSFAEWEEEFSVYDDDLKEELRHVDEREQSLTAHINTSFDELRELLEKRRSNLIEQVEQTCHENKQSIHNIIKMKKESKELLSEFDHLDEMSGFEVIDKKLNRLNLISALYEKMRTEFKSRKLSDLHKVSLDKFTSRKNIIQHNLDELGLIVNKVSTTTRDDDNNNNTISPSLSSSMSISFKHVETIGSSSINNSNKNCVQFNFPSDIRISYQHSSIVVSDFGNKRIRVLDLTTRQFKYDIETVSAPRNISIDHTDDDALIVSCADHCVYKYSLLNQGKSIIWRSGTPNESGNSKHLFKYPRASIVDKDGNVNVCDHGNHRVKVLRSSDGNVEKLIGGDDEVQFKRPWGIWIDRDDNLVVSEKKNNRIQRISKDGDNSLFQLGRKGSSQYEFNKPRGVLIDAHNENIFVCDGANHRIQIFSKAGKFIKSFGSEGSKSNQLFQPHSLCFDMLSGQLLVADCGNHRIQVFQ